MGRKTTDGHDNGSFHKIGVCVRSYRPPTNPSWVTPPSDLVSGVFGTTFLGPKGQSDDVIKTVRFEILIEIAGAF